MVTKILSQGPIMANLALKCQIDGCRRMERGILRYLLPWKPKCCHGNQKMCSMWPNACFSLPSKASLVLDLSMNCWSRVGRLRYLFSMVAKTLPWWPKMSIRPRSRPPVVYLPPLSSYITQPRKRAVKSNVKRPHSVWCHFDWQFDSGQVQKKWPPSVTLG